MCGFRKEKRLCSKYLLARIVFRTRPPKGSRGLYSHNSMLFRKILLLIVVWLIRGIFYHYFFFRFVTDYFGSPVGLSYQLCSDRQRAHSLFNFCGFMVRKRRIGPSDSRGIPFDFLRPQLFDSGLCESLHRRNATARNVFHSF